MYVHKFGISYTDYWEMQPITVSGIIREYDKKFVRDFNCNLWLVWQLGGLIGIAVNNPKQYPKECPEGMKTEEDKKNDKAKLLEFALKLEAKYRSQSTKN